MRFAVLGSGGRGALMVLALVLLASAVMRFAGGDRGQAVAQGLSDQVAAIGMQDLSASPNETPIQAQEITPLLAAIRAREQSVSQREQGVQAELNDLARKEERIKAQLEALESAKAQLEEVVSQAKTASQADVGHLTTLYETMKPKQAAQLFEQMESTFAAGFLGLMKPEAAAAVLAGMSPSKAYEVSVVLAGRNADLLLEPQ